MRKYDAQSEYVFRDEQEEIEKAFHGAEDPAEHCSVANLTVNNNVNHILAKDMGHSSGDYELDI
jgi:hypothetical protein